VRFKHNPHGAIAQNQILFQLFALAAGMPALAGELNHIFRIGTYFTAVFLPLGRNAVTGRMRAFGSCGHEELLLQLWHGEDDDSSAALESHRLA
jgi:hypothetical protein